MNSLSWLLYGAEVANNAQGALFIAIVGCVGAAGANALFGPMLHDSMNSYRSTAEDFKPIFRTSKRLLVAAIILAPIAVVLPSKQTIMLIAASEVGETILASPQAQQIGGEAGELAVGSLQVLRNFINEQLAEPEKAPAK